MWRWWILAGLVVMALGVATMVVAVPSGGPDHCIERFYEEGRMVFNYNQVGEDFHQVFSSRFDVTIGEAVLLGLTVRNTQDHERRLGLGTGPSYTLVTTPDCRVVWLFPRNVLLSRGYKDVDPHEEIRFGGKWSLTDKWGELVSPGYYYVYKIVKVDEDPTDGSEFTHAELVGSQTVWVSEAHLRAARIRHPPTPAHPCISGDGPVYEAHVRQVMERRSDVLAEWRRQVANVLAADILDENRMSTGRRGIRVFTMLPLEERPEDSLLRGLPDCLDGVPVQIVVYPDIWRPPS